jgi:hypothetical protein
MRRAVGSGSSYVILGLLLAVSCATARSVAADPLTPAAIEGRWATRCAAGLPDVITFRPAGAEVASGSGTLTCRSAGHRSLGEARFYLDLECQDGSLLQLDVYRAARDELLIARRPLGEACVYRR